MADTPVRGAAPIGSAGGFAERHASPMPSKPRGGGEPRSDARAPDRVVLAHGAACALRLLRGRVLARTRERLELAETSAVPVFAEAFEHETVPEFVGRLLSAQNQLAAARAGDWEAARVRDALAHALRDGAREAAELLGADGGTDAAARAAVAEVLAELERRFGPFAAGG